MRLKVKDVVEKRLVVTQLIEMGYVYNRRNTVEGGMADSYDNHLYMSRSTGNNNFSSFMYAEGRVVTLGECIPLEFLSYINTKELGCI